MAPWTSRSLGGNFGPEKDIFSPKFFRPKVFSWTSAWDVHSEMLVFSRIWRGLTEVFGGMSAGMSGRKLPLWAEYSFLKIREAS